jgi:4-hydroxy-tetrahydrodipicolinate reductase
VAPPIRVAMAGATGRTGREVARALLHASDVELVAALGREHVGRDLGEVVGLPALRLPIAAALEDVGETGPDVLVDFTEPDSAFPRLVAAVERGWSLVVGTTGFSETQVADLRRRVAAQQVGAALIANFSVGAWVADRLAAEAARYFRAAEVVEGHHAGKRDRPSGTARRTAARLAALWGRPAGDVAVHSLRLPGLVAHQSVVFGASGEILPIRHDVHDRSAYAAGVLAAVRRVQDLRGEMVEDLGTFLGSLT